MFSYDQVRFIHLELTTRCNAACPGCIRNLCGVEVPDISDGYPLCELTIDDIKRIFPAKTLGRISNLLINGNYGDFVASRDGLEIVQYLASSNPFMQIIISTNGSARPTWWGALAKIRNLEIQFCLDGLKGTHEKYRRNTNWDTVIENAKTFISHGGRATWKMIKFDINEHQIPDCEQLSKELGFREIIVVDHGRNSFPVFNRNKEFLYTIGNHTNTDFEQTIELYRDGIDGKFLQSLPDTEIRCPAKDPASIYICANGDVYPCCFLGTYPALTNISQNREVLPYVSKNNAIEHGIQDAIRWFEHLDKTFNENPLYNCKLNCSMY